MVAFISGSKSGTREDLEAAMEYVQEFEGLKEIKISEDYPGIAILCFDTKESAQAAQWMLELNGAEGRDGSDAAGVAGDDG